MEKRNTTTNNTMEPKRFDVEIVRRHYLRKTIKDRVIAEFNWHGTVEQVINRAKAIVRPLIGGGEYDGDYERIISFDSIDIQEGGGGFLIYYDVKYLDEIRSKYMHEQIVIEGIELP